MALDGISDVGGVVTFSKPLKILGDLKLTQDLDVVENVALSGDLLVGKTITEGTPAVVNTFGLVIPNIPLAANTKGFTVAPFDLEIVSMYAVHITSVFPNAALTIGVAGVDDGETLAITFTVYPGAVDVLTFSSAPPADAGDPIRVYSNAGGTGTVNVMLLCKLT